MDQIALFDDALPPVHLSIAATEWRGCVALSVHRREPDGTWIHDRYDRLTPAEALDVLDHLVTTRA